MHWVRMVFGEYLKNPSLQSFTIPPPVKSFIMVLILDGNSKIGPHLRINLR